MSNISISRLGGNTPYNQYIANHPNKYHNLSLDSFGGSGGSKPKGTTEYEEHAENTADIEQHSSRIEHVESVVESVSKEQNEGESEVRKSFKSNGGRPDVHEETLEDDEPKKTLGQKFCAIFCCCFKTKEKRNPLLYRSKSSAGSDD